MNWKTIQGLVPASGQSPDFDACLGTFPQLRLAINTDQSAPHHREGTVWVHTQMCIEELLGLSEYQKLPRADQEVVFLALLLHDIAKCSTTVVDPETGRIGHPGHSRKGAIDARIALWDAGVPFEQREAICRLVQSHQYPMWALTGSRSGKSPEYLVRWLSWQMNLRLLALLAEADMRGRICDDAQTALDNIELFRELAHEEDCFETQRQFVNAHTRLRYFRGADVHPDYPLFQEPGSKVTVMCGLPASGKNTWVAAHRKGLPIVSFDDAREELGLRHGKTEGVVAHHAVDKAKDLLRAKAPFVWNATHLSQSMRDKTLDLLFAYSAEVELVYLERPRAELLRRNTRRDTSLTNKALEAMLHKWELPLPTETHSVSYELA
ncbi:MAG: AAA family ATPase [Agitococcus sp.]|nr:AAA family ATPase [Agitococcus sp.]